MERKDELINLFSKNVREILNKVALNFDEVQEIRLRVAAPLMLVYRNEEYYLTDQGISAKSWKKPITLQKTN